jgi:FkbM family methyltransferase
MMHAKSQLKRLLRTSAVSGGVTRALLPLARWLPDGLLFRVPLSRSFIVEMPNSVSSFRLDGVAGDVISTKVYWRGLRSYEAPTVDLLARLSPRTAVFIDVGANIGLYSLMMAALNPATEVHAVEPVPAIFSLLRRNAALNGFPNLRLHQLAIGNATGTTEIHVPVDHLVPIEASLLAGFRPNTAPVAVQVATLDSFVDRLGGGDVSLVKIDTEGTTADVLEGAQSLLVRQRPHLICEVLSGVPSESRVGAMLEEIGYSGFSMTAAGPRRSAEIVGDPAFENLNYLFVHESRIADLDGVL